MKAILISLAIGFTGGQALAYYSINLVDQLVDFTKGLFGKAKAEEQKFVSEFKRKF